MYLKLAHIKCSSNKPYKVLLCMLSILAIVHIINLILIFTNVFPASNYMFTSKAPPMDWVARLADAFGNTNKFIRCCFLMIMGYMILTACAYSIHKFIEVKCLS